MTLFNDSWNQTELQAFESKEASEIPKGASLWLGLGNLNAGWLKLLLSGHTLEGLITIG